MPDVVTEAMIERGMQALYRHIDRDLYSEVAEETYRARLREWAALVLRAAQMSPSDDDTIERAARAIHDLHPWLYGQTLDGEDIHLSWNDASASVKNYYRDEARVALAASTMRPCVDD